MGNREFLGRLFPPKRAWFQTYSRVTEYRGAFLIFNDSDVVRFEGKISGPSDRLFSAVSILTPWEVVGA